MQKIDSQGKTVLIISAAGFIESNLEIELLKAIEDIQEICMEKFSSNYGNDN